MCPCFHEGVRYFMRGVDSDGHVANYIETEQIIMYHEHKASFVQVRISALSDSMLMAMYCTLCVNNLLWSVVNGNNLFSHTW